MLTTITRCNVKDILKGAFLNFPAVRTFVREALNDHATVLCCATPDTVIVLTEDNATYTFQRAY